MAISSIDTSSNNSLVRVNDVIVVSYFDNDDYTLADNDDGCYIYVKAERKCYQITLDKFNETLIKLAKAIGDRKPYYYPVHGNNILRQKHI